MACVLALSLSLLPSLALAKPAVRVVPRVLELASGHCGAGAPRFDVTTSDGSLYFFGCLDGTHGPAGDKQHPSERVRFGDMDAVPASASEPPWPGFGQALIESIEIVFDEGIDVGSGFTALDDIDIDGQLIGSGGRSHHRDRDDDNRDCD